jgi:hypothetical protein
MVAIYTLLAVALTQLAITASAGSCKTFQVYCGSTLKWRGMLSSISALSSIYLTSP